MPAAMHAPMTGLDVPDQPLLPAHRQAGVALESGQSSRAGGSKLPRCRWMIGRSAAAAGGRGAASSFTQAVSAGSYSPAIARAASSRSTSSRLTVA